MLVRAHHVPLRETMLWVEPHIPRPNARILEVGCGHGHVAAALRGAGHDVVAIDTDGEAVKAARYKGVDARVGDFPSSDLAGEERFDVILFTRSLHHIHELDGACVTAFTLLANGGSILVEDWSWNTIDERAAAWIYGMMGVGHAAGIVPDDLWPQNDNPLATWLDAHRGHIHEVKAMREAMQKAAARSQHTVAIEEEPAPYVYRYFAGYTAQDDDGDEHSANGAALTEALLNAERQMLAANAMAPLGWRLSAVSAD